LFNDSNPAATTLLLSPQDFGGDKSRRKGRFGKEKQEMKEVEESEKESGRRRRERIFSATVSHVKIFPLYLKG